MGTLEMITWSSYSTRTRVIAGLEAGNTIELHVWVDYNGVTAYVKDFQISVGNGPWIGVTLD